MRSLIGAVLAVCVVLSAGCASVQRPVSLSMDGLAKPAKVGVALSTIPKPDTQFPGAACLLCLAAANVFHSTLTTYTNSLPTEELASLPVEIAARLRASGVDAKAIDERIEVKSLPGLRTSGENIPAKDYRAFATKHGVDKLIVLEVALLGFERAYSQYVPIGDPKGFIYGTGYLIDLQSNTYQWYTPIRVQKSSEGPWDEPPKFPGLTNAYFQALEIGRDQWLQPFGPR